MSVLCWGLSLFWLAFIVHLIVWKIRLPKRQTRTLLLLFFGTLLLGLGLLWHVRNVLPDEMCAPLTLPEYLHIALFVISLTLAYMITYSALEADSPSLVMIMNVANAGADGLEKRTFEQRMDDDTLIIPRIRDLLRDQLIYEDGAKYKLTVKGILFARIFILYRQVLKIRYKGG